jgi:hypothetical protein
MRLSLSIFAGLAVLEKPTTLELPAVLCAASKDSRNKLPAGYQFSQADAP